MFSPLHAHTPAADLGTVSSESSLTQTQDSLSEFLSLRERGLTSDRGRRGVRVRLGLGLGVPLCTGPGIVPTLARARRAGPSAERFVTV